MAFFTHTVDDGRNLPHEYLPAGAITPKAGMALVMSGGVLTVATGTVKPEYISMVEKSAAVATGTVIPVTKVHSDIIYETENTAAFDAIKPGDKVTLAAGGLGVTATTTSGVATVVHIEGTPVGSKIRVRF